MFAATRSLDISDGLHVLSGSSFLAKSLQDSLSLKAYKFQPIGSIVIILDTPRGFAFQANLSLANTLIVTDSLCGEYWEDLWDLSPTVLLAGSEHTEEIHMALMQASKGICMKLTPSYQTPLTASEKKILYLCARAHSNKKIASSLKLSESTVKNNLNNIYKKLDLKNRTDLMLYYWGVAISPPVLASTKSTLS